MYIDFHFSTYFYDERERLPLDVFFREILAKVRLYEHHAQSTRDLYKDEYFRSKTNLKEAYDARIKKADEIYHQVYEEVEGNEQDKHQFARHEAGYDEHEFFFQQGDQAINRRFTEMREYFYQSSLTLAYALLENEIRKVCRLLKTEFGKRIALEDFNDRNYLAAMRNYLDLVVELTIDGLESYFTRFRELQFLRNRFMHNGGEFESGSQNADIIEDYVQSSGGGLERRPLNSGTEQVVIAKLFYVEQYFSLFSHFFSALLWVIDEKLRYKYLTHRLAFLFGFLADGIQVQISTVEPVQNGRRIALNMTGENEEGEFNYQCIFSFQKANVPALEFFNQLAQASDMVARLQNQLTVDLVMEHVLACYCLENTPNNVAITIWEND